MSRSITFIIPGEVGTRVRITENGDGTLSFQIDVIGPGGSVGDLRALFFDVSDPTLIGGLSILDGDDVTELAQEDDGIDSLGHGANLKGSVTRELGDFDVGIEFGTPGAGSDDIQSTSFVLDHATEDLTLEDLSLQDFGVRITSIGVEGQGRNSGLKAGGSSTAAITAGDDSAALDEGSSLADVDLLGNDRDTGGAAITGSIISASADGAALVIDDGVGAAEINDTGFGLLTIHADGTFDFDATGVDVSADTEFSFSYVVESSSADSLLSTDSADVTITVKDLGGGGAPATFGSILAGIDFIDQSGVSVSDAGDVNGDGIADIIIGAFFADPIDKSPTGEAYVIFGTSSGLPATLSLDALDGTNGFRVQGIDSNDRFGIAVSGAGDINGDGVDDVIIGATGGSPSDGAAERIGAGESYVVYGKDTTLPGVSFSATLSASALDGSNGFVVNGVDGAAGLDPGDASGKSVSSAGDVNGDGVDDFIIGSDFGGDSYVVFGSAAFGASFELSALDGSNGFAILGSPDDAAGRAVSAAGDINGDGIADIVVGAPNADVGAGTDAGASYLIYGKDTAQAGVSFGATIDLATLSATEGIAITGASAFDNSGVSVSAIGDFNNDGTDDLVIGASGLGGATASGEAYVVFGGNAAFGTGTTFDLATLDGSNGLILRGIDAGDRAGTSVSNVGDVNGDGFDDLLIGASAANFQAGESYLVFGSGSYGASFDLASLERLDGLAGTDGFIFRGIDGGDQSGAALSGAGDINGDGVDDLLIGAPGTDLDSFNEGESYAIYGGQSLLEAFDLADGTADGAIDLLHISDLPFV